MWGKEIQQENTQQFSIVDLINRPERSVVLDAEAKWQGEWLILCLPSWNFMRKRRSSCQYLILLPNVERILVRSQQSATRLEAGVNTLLSYWFQRFGNEFSFISQEIWWSCNNWKEHIQPDFEDFRIFVRINHAVLAYSFAWLDSEVAKHCKTIDSHLSLRNESRQVVVTRHYYQ